MSSRSSSVITYPRFVSASSGAFAALKFSRGVRGEKMAVVPRKTKDGTVYRVAILHKGKQYWEAAGSDRREADRLDARRKREVANGQYIPPQARSGGTTVISYAERFFDARTNRNAESERTQVERHAV